MVSLTSTTKACLLAAFWSFSWISCLPTPPSKLVENTAFDLNELPRDVEEAESSALHSSTLEPTDRTGSSSTPGHAFATQPHQSAHFRPYWHLSEASTSSSRPLGHSFGWQYADMPTVQYHPVLLQPQWQPTSFAAGPYWPHDQSFNAEHVNQPGAVQMQAFVQQPAPTLGTEHAPAVTFAQPRTWKSSAEPGELSSGGAYGELRAQHSPSVTTSNILVSGPSGNPRDRADTDPLLVRSPETDGNVPLLPVKKLRYEPRKRHDLPKAAASSRAIVAGELAAQNRHYDPKDLRPLSGSYFRFSQRNDPKVTRLINELRLPASADDADGTRANRAYLQRSRFPANPDTFFRTPSLCRSPFRSQSVQDPTLFSGVSFEAAILYETKVNTFVASLRNTASSSSQQRSAEGDQPAFLSTGAQRDPSTFIRRYFIQRKEAKQVLLPDAAGTRSLFFILLTNHRLVFSRDLSSLVGVWEFASHPQSDKLRLYFRGFHHFYGAEYHTLEQNPQATGSRFWFQLDQTTPLVSNEQLTLRIVRGELGPKTKEQLFSETGEVSHPDIQELIWSKRLDRVLAMKHLIPGRHLFIYQESSKTVAIIRRWKAHARLGAYSFELRPLLWQQVEDIPFIASARFRKPQAVKVVTEKDGEMFMLAFSARLDWLADYLPSAVAVWQIGPEIQGSRLMICRGFFNLNRGAYDQLTPQSVPGLRDSTFQYNMLGLP